MGDHADQLLKFKNFFGSGDGVGMGDVRGGSEINDFELFFRGEVIEHGVEQEAIQLGFGKRVRPFEFDGVLRGQNKKWSRQKIIVPAHSAGAFLHSFQEG